MKNKLISLGIGCLAGLAMCFVAEAHKPKAEVMIEKQNIIQEVEEAQEVKEVVQEVKLYDVPLSEDLQIHIMKECEKSNICPAVVFAIIEQESGYNENTVGDDGESIGLMQIQKKWHLERMEKLGVTDLANPFQNVTVGIDYLLELFQEKADVYWVLMAYNGGKAYATENWDAGNYSDYALEVSERAIELEQGE